MSEEGAEKITKLFESYEFVKVEEPSLDCISHADQYQCN